MRFEIRTGGLIGILIGLALLSGAVFVLGLLAGYDVGRQSEVDGAQIATAYPLPPPPNAMPSPVATSPPAASTSPSAVSVSENNPASSNTPSSANSPRPGHTPPKTANAAGGIGESSIPPSPPHPRASSAETAANGRPVPSPVSTPRQAEANARSAAPAPRPVATPARTAAAENPPPAPRPRRKPYNIQIEAAMDRQGADAMVQRLEQLGYQPHLVPTQIDGATWFKVEIGPYATEEEAESAQDELRVRYNKAFGVGAARNPAR